MNRDPRASDNSTPPPTQTDLPALLGALAGRLPALIFLASFVLAIAILYFGQTVLIPVAFSLLLTFLLSPIVDGLEGVGLGRIPSVVLVVILAFSVLASIGWIVTVQITTLVSEIPRYERNIRQKVIDLKQMTKGGTIEQVQKTVKEIKQEIEKEEKAGRKEAAPVVVQAERDSTFWPLPTIAGPVVERLASIGLAVVLVIFMLAERDELRNRLIRLVGYGRMTITTKALQDAGHRISRYLLMQSLINSAFGLAVAFGLFMIGLPYAALWGFLAAVLRFIPYVGPWVAAIMPAALGLAVFEGWLRPLAVAGLFVVLELLTNMILEPLLWGGSAGVSQVALLVSVAFWTWLWGPIGLLMATPLTVCLVVLGKYVPQLQYITVLMSDEPVAESSVVYYQRLLAMDREEAAQIVTAYVENHSRDQVYDRVLIPALNFAKMDRERGGLTDSEEQFIYQETRAILEKLDSEQGASMAASGTAGAARENGAAPRQTVRVLGCPARDEADEVALLMLKQLLASTRYEVEVIGDERLVSEVIAAAGEKRTGLIFIAALPPGGLAHTRYLCKRLRAQLSDLKIVVGLWGLPDEQLDAARKTLVAAGADQIGTSLLESRDQVSSLGQL
ncbi:MAG TPA: AI-2E family transporter, partial [Candidatus Eisenbacteria bacterium]|nr:AI-2E family transporter [Candidatus Eisenbacteria bacterium]